MKTALFGLTAVCVLCLGVASGGPLTPPAGPVASTGKTLTQVEPRTPIQSLAGLPGEMYRITQPGSYYLTGNLELPIDKNVGIAVGADGVTIDLNGFTISGSNLPASVGIRVVDGFSCDGLRVHNGHITDWDVGVSGLGMFGAVFENLRLTFNDVYGLDAGNQARISNCTALVCGEGFYLRDGGSISDSTAAFCGRGFDLGVAAVVSNCAARDCGDGFFLNVNCVATSCVAYGCFNGFVGNFDNTLEGCSAGLCTDGFRFTTNNRLYRCSVTSASGAPIIVGDGSTVESCSVGSSNLTGITIGSNSAVRGNHISDCGGSGIYVTGSHNMVIDNTVIRCALADGVLVDGNDNQFEMNRIEGSGLDGIKVFGERNLLVRNRVCASARLFAGALDYNLGPGNFLGTVLLPSSFVNTDQANANFSCGFVPPGATASAPGAQQANPATGRRTHPDRPVTPSAPAGR